MSIIGHIRRKPGKSEDVLEGDISTLLHNFRFRLIRMLKSDNPSAPGYRAVTWNDNGIEIDIGAAWIKHIKRGEHEGDEFLTLTFDDPSFPNRLNVAAFKNDQTGDWDIMFRRRQDRAA